MTATAMGFSSRAVIRRTRRAEAYRHDRPMGAGEGATAMVTALSRFRPIEGLENLFVAEGGNLRCTAIRLTDGGLCLFSPVNGLGDDAPGSLARLGDVRVLLAPNHYHNNGLAQYFKRFPTALLCASEAARPRLEKVTGLKLQTLDDVRTALPTNVACLQPLGLKNGEIWLRAVGSNHTAWIVADAFCGPKGRADLPATEPALLSTFPRFGIGDRVRYLDWATKQISTDDPTMLVPCHGAIVASPRLAAQLRILIGAAA